MPTAVSRRRRSSSSESSDASSSSSSSDDDEISLPSTVIKRTELTIKDDDEEVIPIQAALPEEYGESDDERRTLSRVLESSASGLINDEKKQQQINKKKRKRLYFICLSMCKYDCVRRASKRLNFREVSDEDDWNVYWTDTSVGIERVAQMKKWQKINHFPGMSEICRKDSLTRNMSRMMKMFPKEYSFYPKAWCLPADYNDFVKYCSEKKCKTYISKPDVGCQGRGIFITKNPSKDIKPTDNFVVQVYVNRPFLVDGYKFDFRVYVAVTSCDPFRVFVYKDGLARFTTQHYEEPSNANCKDIFMHLTNYAIQKRSDDFIRDEDTGTKRRITTINRWLVENGYDIVKLWADIDDVIIKVLISAHSVLKHNYRACFPHHYRGSACFEILGFDILIDRKLKPYVLEVNHSPSFTTDSKLDRDIKDALIYDTLLLLNMPAADKRRFLEEEKRRVKERLFQRVNKKDNEFRKEQEDLAHQWQIEIEQWENEHMGNYRRIYPLENQTEKYDKFFTQSGTLYSETAASKARIEQAKAQIDELQKKQDQFNALKNSKSFSSNSRETYGESPSKRTLPTVKSSRSSSFNRPHIKRLTASISLSSSNNRSYGDTVKPIEIDESEEIERVIALKHRETLIRGMGIVDMCHRILFGTSGTMANVPTNNLAYTQQHVMPQIEPTDASRNFSLMQYVDSKLPNRQQKTLPNPSAQVLQQYFTNQQTTSSRSGRYQQPLRSTIQTNLMPQIAANFLPKTPVTIDASIRKSASTSMVRQRTGNDTYLISCDSDHLRKEIVVSGSSIPTGQCLKTLGLLPNYDRLKQQSSYRKSLLPSG